MKIIIAIIGILLLIIIINQNPEYPLQKFPWNNSVISERHPIFMWQGKAKNILIDDNENFVSPVIENVSQGSHHLKNKLNFTNSSTNLKKQENEELRLSFNLKINYNSRN